MLNIKENKPLETVSHDRLVRRPVITRTRKITMKVVLVGDQAVGKTCLRNRYLNEGYEGRYRITIGAEFSVKRFVDETKTTCLQIWDLAGQKHFKSVRSLYYSGAVGVVIVYDVTRRESFERIPEWIDEVLQHNQGVPLPLLIVANKIDLRGDGLKLDDCVTSAEGEQLVLRIQQEFQARGHAVPVKFCETSAKSGVGIEDAIDQFFKSLITCS